MTNEEVMQLMTDMGLHEGGMENWVSDNAWVDFANQVEKRKCEELANKIAQMPFGDTSASFAIWVREQQ